MASLSRHSNGHKTIQFTLQGKRETVRLGKCNVKQAEKARTHIEFLVAAVITQHPIDSETAKWVSALESGLAEKLARVGLIPNRLEQSKPVEDGKPRTLKAFLGHYIGTRTDVKDRTLSFFNRARASLLAFFPDDKPLDEITAGDAREWRLWLFRCGSYKGKPLAQNTVNDRCKKAKQFFNAAIEYELLGKNPFAKLPGSVRSNRAKFHFVTLEETVRLLDTAPDMEWRLLLALCRYGGLRSPSETMILRWQNIDWQRSRMIVFSPKTERHEGRECRTVPIFPELRPFLEEAWESAEPGAEYLLEELRTHANLGTRLVKIIQRAGLKRWPRVFHNLRASRQTELENTFPTHVVCDWLGNNESTAREHYLRVTEDHFHAATGGALQNALQQPTALSGNQSQVEPVPHGNAPILLERAKTRDSLQLNQYTRQESNL